MLEEFILFLNKIKKKTLTIIIIEKTHVQSICNHIEIVEYNCL